jgi:hypothetical protein
LVECVEGAGEGREGEVDVGAMFIADGQTAEAREPRQRTLDHPTVAAQALTASDAPAATAVIVGFVGVQLAGPVAMTQAGGRWKDPPERFGKVGTVKRRYYD